MQVKIGIRKSRSNFTFFYVSENTYGKSTINDINFIDSVERILQDNGPV